MNIFSHFMSMIEMMAGKGKTQDGNLSNVIIPDINTDGRISTVWESPRFC